MNSHFINTAHSHMVECSMPLEPAEYPLYCDTLVVEPLPFGGFQGECLLMCAIGLYDRLCSVLTIDVCSEVLGGNCGIMKMRKAQFAPTLSPKTRGGGPFLISGTKCTIRKAIRQPLVSAGGFLCPLTTILVRLGGDRRCQSQSISLVR